MLPTVFGQWKFYGWALLVRLSCNHYGCTCSQKQPTECQMSKQPSRSSRRDFFLGRITGQKPIGEQTAQSDVSDVEWSDEGHDNATAQKQAGYLEQYAKNAMGCEFEFSFNLRQYSQASEASAQAFDLVDELEDLMTIYRDHSQISSVNRYGVEQPIRIESDLVALLVRAKILNQLTDGAFAITSGHLSDLWGFEKRKGRLPTESAIQSALELVCDDLIKVDESKSTVSLLKPNVKINLGGIGKGYAIDRVGQLLRRLGIADFAIHGGQSSVLACGTSEWSHDEPTQSQSPSSSSQKKDHKDTRSPGWTVGISHPTIPNVRLGELTLKNRAMGTSGTARQGFYFRGKRYGHILDPRTGWPTSHFLSTTVIADQAETADALATAFFVMELDEIEGICQKRPDVGVILVRPMQPGNSQVSLTTINVEPDEFKVLSK